MISKKILKEVARGSHKAFDRLYLHYSPTVEKFAVSILGNREDAADIAQNVFLKVWEVRAILPGIRSFDSWLFTITRNAVINFIKKKKPTLRNGNEWQPKVVDEHTPEEHTALRDEIGRAQAIIESQPEQRMKVFLMSRVMGMSYKEISQELGISQKTVENHIGRVLHEIKSRMDAPLS